MVVTVIYIAGVAARNLELVIDAPVPKKSPNFSKLIREDRPRSKSNSVR